MLICTIRGITPSGPDEESRCPFAIRGLRRSEDRNVMGVLAFARTEDRTGAPKETSCPLPGYGRSQALYYVRPGL